MPTKCIKCGYDLTSGEYIAPWEEGNEYGYIICPNCGCKNEEWIDD